MKKVLMITYFFPPMGGVAVQRITKFCKFLPEFGWQPIVLTVKNGYWTVWDHSNQDYKTGHEIIYRTPFFSPFTLLRKLSFGKPNFGTTSEDKGKAIEKPSWRKRLMRTISMLWCVPDEFISWFPFAYFYGLKIIKRHKVDLIFANDSPHTCSIIALLLSKVTGIPFIADFRDLWTGYEEYSPRNKIEAKLQRRLEKKVVKNVGKVITVTEALGNTLKKMWSDRLDSKLEIIYNGFDLDDYDNQDEKSTPRRKFNIVYTGSNFSNYTNPNSFLVALSRLINKDKLKPIDIGALFVGSNSEELKRMIGILDIGEYVSVQGNISHKKACSLQRSANLLLLIHRYSNATSGKLLEYLAAGFPILAIAPDGEVTKIIQKTGAGVVVNPNDIDDIERCLTLLYEKIHIKEEAFQRNETEINKFNRRDQTKRLAEIFDDMMKS